MSRIVITDCAAEDIKRCLDFLFDKSVSAMIKATSIIKKSFSVLEYMPKIGKPFTGDPNLRELSIKFGKSGYLALYHFDENEDVIHIVAFKHHRENRYKSRIEY